MPYKPIEPDVLFTALHYHVSLDWHRGSSVFPEMLLRAFPMLSEHDIYHGVDSLRDG